tara:strand:- start:97 stop:390 length:294 start_codon:yes stop_codon:yes gene_type:complete
MTDAEKIHTATLIRLEVAVAALALASGDLSKLILDHLPRDERGPYLDTMSSIYQAIRIARGEQTEVPGELTANCTMSVMRNPAAVARFLVDKTDCSG